MTPRSGYSRVRMDNGTMIRTTHSFNLRTWHLILVTIITVSTIIASSFGVAWWMVSPRLDNHVVGIVDARMTAERKLTRQELDRIKQDTLAAIAQETSAREAGDGEVLRYLQDIKTSIGAVLEETRYNRARLDRLSERRSP